MGKNLPVLIAGAGPTGLMLACELARYGIKFRIIDINPQPTLTSNATWIQTRTIEILDEINLLDKFLQYAHKCTDINLYTYGNLTTKISLDSISSDFKFILNLPQSDTERIFNGYLSTMYYEVERPVELITVRNKKKGVHVLLGQQDNQIEELDCDWLVACDGANSTVRKVVNMSFSGNDFTQKFIVADVELDASFYPNEVNIFFDAGTVLAAFPMRGYKFRINANLFKDSEKFNLTPKELYKMVIERTYKKSRVTKVYTISPYFIHNRLVKKMRDRFILFAGDAAHVHSPAGGQV